MPVARVLICWCCKDVLTPAPDGMDEGDSVFCHSCGEWNVASSEGTVKPGFTAQTILAWDPKALRLRSEWELQRGRLN